jgi:hypothetical protein
VSFRYVTIPSSGDEMADDLADESANTMTV